MSSNRDHIALDIVDRSKLTPEQNGLQNSVSGTKRGSLVTFHNVTYTVTVTPHGKPPCVKRRTEILHGVR